MIRDKSIYDPIDPKKDGYRLLVTRFWPRGVRKSAVDSWDRRLGAPVALIGKKKAGKLTKAELRKIYVASLDRDALAGAVALARKKTVTLLCTCRDDLCHRVVLAALIGQARAREERLISSPAGSFPSSRGRATRA